MVPNRGIAKIDFQIAFGDSENAAPAMRGRTTCQQGIESKSTTRFYADAPGDVKIIGDRTSY
jgi:hypothetical protein